MTMNTYSEFTDDLYVEVDEFNTMRHRYNFEMSRLPDTEENQIYCR